MAGLGVRTAITNRQAQRALERLAAGAEAAVRRGLLKVGFVLGRKIAETIETGKKWPPGTRRLSRSFLIPRLEGLGVILGAESPVYALIQERGGTIKAKSAPYLTFMTADGEWHRVQQVTIPAKHYVERSIDATREEAVTIMGLEIAAEWEA